MVKHLLLFAVFGCSLALAQTQAGSVRGQVRDANGNPATSVRVALISLPVGVPGASTYGGQTNANGEFAIGNVPPGQYDLFVAARETTILAGTADASPAIVITPSTGPFNVQSWTGTFYPGTAEISQATAITVNSGTTETVNFPLASGAVTWKGPALRAVRGRIVFEGGAPSSTISPFALFFSDGPDSRSALLTFRDQPGKPSMRLESPTPGIPNAATVVPMPAFPDGAFKLSLPEGVYRVSQSALSEGGPLSHLGGYYVKGLSLGTTDIMKNLMTVGASMQGEFVITLAKCTDVRQVPLCH